MIKIRPRVVIQVVVLIKKKNGPSLRAVTRSPWNMKCYVSLVSFDMLSQLAFPWRWMSQQKKHKQEPTSVSLWITSCTVCVCVYIWMTSKLENLCHVLFAWLHQCAMSHTAISRHKHSTSLGIEWHGVMDCRPWPHASTHLLRCWSVIGETFGHNELRS